MSVTESAEWLWLVNDAIGHGMTWLNSVSHISRFSYVYLCKVCVTTSNFLVPRFLQSTVQTLFSKLKNLSDLADLQNQLWWAGR